MLDLWPIFPIFVLEMGNYQFKRFVIEQDLCAMKVGTDGVLLGAWADGGKRILDIGAGTGLIALMMAQRFTDALITGVELDGDAYRQAMENVANSPFFDRVGLLNESIQCFAEKTEYQHTFDAIVCNPPFFENSLRNRDEKETLARHNDLLPWADLVDAVQLLMADGGFFSFIVPKESYSHISQQLYIKGFKEYRSCKIKTTEKKPVKRVLAAFTNNLSHPASTEQQLLLSPSGNRSEWYQNITKDFYIK